MKSWLKRQLIVHGGLAGALAMGFFAGYSSHDAIDAKLTDVRCQGHPVEVGFFEDPAGLSLESQVNANGRSEVYLVHESGARAQIPHDVFSGRDSWSGVHEWSAELDCDVLGEYAQPIMHYCRVCNNDEIVHEIDEAILHLVDYESVLPIVERPQNADQFYDAAQRARVLLEQSESRMAAAYARVQSIRTNNPSFPIMPDCSSVYDQQQSRLRYAREQGVRLID